MFREAHACNLKEIFIRNRLGCPLFVQPNFYIFFFEPITETDFRCLIFRDLILFLIMYRVFLLPGSEIRIHPSITSDNIAYLFILEI